MNSRLDRELRAVINHAHLKDENKAVEELHSLLIPYDSLRVSESATHLIRNVRTRESGQSQVEAFLAEYRLNSREGIVLMAIAEALLRIPDPATQDQFLQEKLTSAKWQQHVRQNDSFWVSLSTQALSFTQYIEEYLAAAEQHWFPDFDRLLSRLGAPLIRIALKQAMQYLAEYFVFADSIESAVERMGQTPDYRYSFDMLGEAAISADDAERYFYAYRHAIETLAQHAAAGNPHANAGVSVKLSALCPRYEPLQHVRAVTELTAQMSALTICARAANIPLTIDAEESERLNMSLDVFAGVFSRPELSGWNGFGLAVQAYQKRALPVLRWLAKLAESQDKSIPLRLVKGAYWDSEIKRAQENGLSGYPVFTHKSATDLSYLACAQFLLSQRAAFFPQFATHNAHTLAFIIEAGLAQPDYEFQRLHGMGEGLYQEVQNQRISHIPCRIYAPVGHYHELLPYLVRRLLENGANTSFVNQLERKDVPVNDLVRDPVEQVKIAIKEQKIVLPQSIYGQKRLNSQGLNLANPEELEKLLKGLNDFKGKLWRAGPLINGHLYPGEAHAVLNPADNRLTVGHVILANEKIIEKALSGAAQAFPDWRSTPVSERARYLERAAGLFEEHRLELVSLCVREGGRTVKDALAEVREAVDYCRYYAQSALEQFGEPKRMPGPVGEENFLHHYGRGVFVCISPWNFPIAIFTGQIAAALVAGNCVIAKPAIPTTLTASRCVELMHQAGISDAVLQFLPADGRLIGEHLLTDQRVAGVAFTGSNATAQFINRQLAQQHGAIIPLIAETGGQNVMIADSSALLEQLTLDAVSSAFNSAGQRCSALRTLFVQDEIADRALCMLRGAMQALTLGNPAYYKTDIGPIINRAAISPLTDHLAAMRAQGARFLYQMSINDSLKHGSYFPPTLLEINCLSQITSEVFGPILHVIRFNAASLGRVIEAVNATGFGLTLGIHSRIEGNIKTIRQNTNVGNVYVNRNMIGAVVGAQPFGGMGRSGTGPKAGGPNYLPRFTAEKTVSVNTAAIGGNASLLAENLR